VIDMSFSDGIIQKVWEKGKVVSNNDPNTWRKDECGAWLGRRYYGDRNSQYGWEIDHIKSESRGGGDELLNLRPLQWKNNVNKQDGLTCPIKATGTHNG
jgi:hypothetical protein